MTTTRARHGRRQVAIALTALSALVVVAGGADGAVTSCSQDSSAPAFATAVTFRAAADGWVAGDENGPEVDCEGQGYAEAAHWNGTGWTSYSLENPGCHPQLVDLVAKSASDAWAVGYYEGGLLAYHWNGTAWRFKPPVNPASSDPTESWPATAVDAHARSHIWLVGSYSKGPDFTATGGRFQHPEYTLVLRRAHDKWNRVPSPNPGGTHVSVLTGVAVRSDSNIWAVGFFSPDGKAQRAMILHWNGTHWTKAQTPRLAGASTFTSVAAISSTNAWAVGYETPSSGERRAVTLHWNGARWARVSNPLSADPFTTLNSVAMNGDGHAWAVGFSSADGAPQQSLVLHWDGHQWSTVASPNPNGSGNQLVGVSALPPNGHAYAVGHNIAITC